MKVSDYIWLLSGLLAPFYLYYVFRVMRAKVEDLRNVEKGIWWCELKGWEARLVHRGICPDCFRVLYQEQNDNRYRCDSGIGVFSAPSRTLVQRMTSKRCETPNMLRRLVLWYLRTFRRHQLFRNARMQRLANQAAADDRPGDYVMACRPPKK